MKTRYEAFTIYTPLERAVERYSKKVGVLPTKALVPEYIGLENDEGLEIIRTNRVSCLMLTHESIDLNISTRVHPPARGVNFVSRSNIKNHRHHDGDEEGVYWNDVLRPYNQLGYYPGWLQGVEPPYWQSLRRYVFSRDGGMCANCGRSFKYKSLRAHHVVMKEVGGTDSAHNLITLCQECHDVIHDHYDKLIERGVFAPDVAMLPINELTIPDGDA